MIALAVRHHAQRNPITTNITKSGYYHRDFENSENEVLNPLGKIPLYSTISGSKRVARGLGQFFSYGIMSFFKAISCMFHPIDRKALKWQAKDALVCVENSAHGIANIFRGAIEFFPLAGNLLTGLYDSTGLRFSYSQA